MHPFTSTKKLLNNSHTYNKKSPLSPKRSENNTPKMMLSSQSSRLLSCLTAKPLSKYLNDISQGTPSPSTARTQKLNISYRPGDKDEIDTSRPIIPRTQTARGSPNSKIFTDEEDGVIVQDFHLTEDESPKALSTKCTDKESETTSFLDEDEKERERLMAQLGVYGARPQNRATPRHKEKFRRANMFHSDIENFTNEQLPVKVVDLEDVNDRETLTSTILIAESPKNFSPSTRAGDDDTLSGNSETTSGNHTTTNENLSDMIIAPQENDVQKTKNRKRQKSKINLEMFLHIENLLRLCEENLSNGISIVEVCRRYIEVAPKKDFEEFEKIFKYDDEVKLIRSSFILERLAVALILHFVGECKLNEKVESLLNTLTHLVHQNCVLFGYFITLKLRGASRDNVWVDRLFDLIESEESLDFKKAGGRTMMVEINKAMSHTMKSLIVTLHSKELVYGFNSIVLQLDRISIKDAYSRLLKCLAIYLSDQELKEQEAKYQIGSRKMTRDERTPGLEETKMQDLKDALVKKELEPTKKKVVKKNKKPQTPIYYLPALPQEEYENTYTLVLDLDETLVHFAEIPGKYNELRVRPYADYFLNEVSKYFEVVIFTAGIQEYADWVLDNIDKDKTISHRLYRHHASIDPDSLSYLKDLSLLRRDLSKTLIVDNLPENFKLQPDNGIAIKPWYDDPEDNALLELAPLLTEIARKKAPDVRAALRKFREQTIQNIESGCENPHSNLTLD